MVAVPTNADQAKEKPYAVAGTVTSFLEITKTVMTLMNVTMESQSASTAAATLLGRSNASATLDT